MSNEITIDILSSSDFGGKKLLTFKVSTLSGTLAALSIPVVSILVFFSALGENVQSEAYNNAFDGFIGLPSACINTCLSLRIVHSPSASIIIGGVLSSILISSWKVAKSVRVSWAKCQYLLTIYFL